MRLLVFPILMMCALRGIDMPLLVKSACVLMTALPAGSLTVIDAEQSGCEPGFAVRAVIQTMLFMLATIPAVMLLMNYVFA